MMPNLKPSHWCAILFATLLCASALAAGEPVSKSRVSGIAIGGHDTTAYHELTRDPQAAAVPGDSDLVVRYKGANWHFASRRSADAFAANPGHYAPAYNGHCANALSLGEGLIRTNGTHWEIFEDKLYLFYAARGRNRWMDGDWRSYKQMSDAAWERLSTR